jgi:hypothetical protein
MFPYNPRSYKKVHITPNINLYENTGNSGIITVNAGLDGKILQSFISLQTNPEINDFVTNVIILHEIYTAIVYNSMARIRDAQSHIARREESLLAYPSHNNSLVPTPYDLKIKRIVYQPGFKTGESQENIMRLPYE